ncbi:hypothetical protein [Fusibacter sp. JL216-2]|uniref:hypothetical protein n=1 Tax=Fusibacter sp. JL216-2 TaxID=3071453 RepID=UPI003D3566D1
MKIHSSTRTPIDTSILLLKTYIDVSIFYCFAFPVLFMYYGAFWASITQFFCGLGLICARLAYNYKHYKLSKLVALTASYIAVTTQMLIYMPHEMGFHYLYLALLIVTVMLFKYDSLGAKIRLALITLIICISFFACEFYGYEMYRYLFPDRVSQAMYVVSILGMMIGPVLILLSFSLERSRTNQALSNALEEDPRSLDGVWKV